MRADAPRPTPATDSMMWVLLAESSPSHMIGRVMRLANEAKPRRKRTGPRSHQRMRNTRCRFQKTAALNVRSRLHYSSGGVGSIRQRRAAAGHQRTQGGLSATGRSMRHRWPSRRGSESARIDLRCPTSH